MTHYHNIPTTKINDYSKCITNDHTRFSCWNSHRSLQDANMAPDSLALVHADVHRTLQLVITENHLVFC